MKRPFRTSSLTVLRYMDVEIEVEVSDVIELEERLDPTNSLI